MSAARSEALLPRDEPGRARAVTWLLAALNTIEAVVQPLAEHRRLPRPTRSGRSCGGRKRRRRSSADWRELAAWLGERDYLEGNFTVGDLMMTSVLRNLRHTDLVAAEPRLAAYQARCEARPAFQRALGAQLDAFQAR